MRFSSSLAAFVYLGFVAADAFPFGGLMTIPLSSATTTALLLKRTSVRNYVSFPKRAPRGLTGLLVKSSRAKCSTGTSLRISLVVLARAASSLCLSLRSLPLSLIFLLQLRMLNCNESSCEAGRAKSEKSMVIFVVPIISSQILALVFLNNFASTNEDVPNDNLLAMLALSCSLSKSAV